MSESQTIPEAALEVIEADGRRRTLTISEVPFQIGRGAESGNHVQLADTRISRRAAAILFEDGAFRIEDRGQRHGVAVNGEKVEARVLRDGDVITFGVADTVQIIFRTGQAPEALPQLLTRLEQASSMEAGTRDIRQLSLLLEATALLQSHLPVEEVLGAMVDRAIAITEADTGLLLESDGKGGLRPLVARQRGGLSADPTSLTPSQTAVAQALQRRRSVVEEDLARASGFRDARSVVAQQLRSVVAIPLLSLQQAHSTDSTFLAPMGEMLGVLYLHSRRPATFSRLERQILDA
ncbi:MAG: FHA domain-containing protein, partial [Acidobacteria bacterium]|nr:FHA domain-containing protein [Acidobacteriota bacterium]